MSQSLLMIMIFIWNDFIQLIPIHSVCIINEYKWIYTVSYILFILSVSNNHMKLYGSTFAIYTMPVNYICLVIYFANRPSQSRLRNTDATWEYIQMVLFWQMSK